MQINLKTTGSIVLTEELRAFVAEKVNKLEKLLSPNDTTIMADVELGTVLGGQRTGDVHRAEINLQFKGSFARAEATKETLHRAIDVAVEEIKTELRKTRGRRRDFVRHGAAKLKDLFRKFGSQ